MRLRVMAGVALVFALFVGYSIPAEAATLPSLTKMRSALLRDGDLPSTFDRYRSDDTSTTASSTDPECTGMVSDGHLYDPLRAAPRHVARQFEANSSTGPFVASAVGFWRGRLGADAYLQYLRKALRTCDSWTETDSDGIKFRIRLSRLDFPQLGVDRVALRLTIVGRGDINVIGHADVVFVRIRNAVTIVGESRIGTGLPLDQEALTRLSVTRLRAIL
jgi:hypothetical protein